VSADETDVIIAGGGPVGMGLAIELGQRGVRSIVVERYEQPQPVPKGQNLTQRTMEHFHFWGAERELRAARTVSPDHGIGGITAYGSLLSNYHYDWLRRALVKPYYFTDNERLPQYATERVLRARAADIAAIDVRYGWTAGAAAQDADGVTLDIAPREGGETRHLRGRYLVGCDGSRSNIRAQAGITQTLSDHDRLMVLLVFHSNALNRLLSRFEGKCYYSVLHPDLEGYWRFFGRVDLDGNWFFHTPVPSEARDGGFDFRALLEEAAGAPLDVAFEHIGFWDLRFAIADTYSRGRIFVAGDAAHSHPPYGGYGINTGFEDARNLGWKLAAVLKGWAAPALLDSYHVERHGVFASTSRDFIENVIEADRKFLATFDPGRDRAAFERAWAERANASPAEVDAFEPNYEGSPVVWGDPDGACTAMGKHLFEARAGHHLAPRILSSGENVFERLGEGFTLLALGASADDVEAFGRAAQRLGVPLAIVRDGRGPELETYGARLILVRPDQYVAWAGNDLADAGDAQAILSRTVARPAGS